MEKALHSTKKYIPYFIIGPLFKVIEVIFELLTPFLMKYIVIALIVMIALIIITFELYLNLKCEVYNFLVMSGIFGLIINYLLYKNIYFGLDIVDYMYNKYMLYYLIANIVQIALSIYLYFSINKVTVKKR